MRILELSKKTAFKESKKAQGKKDIKSKTESNGSSNDFIHFDQNTSRNVFLSRIICLNVSIE